MPSFRASAVPLWVTAVAAAALLTGCASSRLSPVTPQGVRLGGDWRLDPSRSDDLGKALAQLRAQARKASPREEGSGVPGPRAGGTQARGEGSPGEERGESHGEQPGQSSGGAMSIGPVPRVSPVDELMSKVPQGSYLRITAGTGAFTVTSGAGSSQYTPGQQSDVSAQQGYAQQISGWKGTDYVIDTRPQWGPEIIQSYGLTQHGRLKVTVRLLGGRIDFTFTRIYERTTRVSPLAPPTND
jgi:hypothetical protein